MWAAPSTPPYLRSPPPSSTFQLQRSHTTCSTERLAETRAPPMARGPDRISDLPEGVLHHILSLLPARDAVLTCVLARSWRNRWQSAPALRITCSELLLSSSAPFVDGLLRARLGGAPLDSCDIDLDQDPESLIYDLETAANRWIRHVLKLKVRELRFRASGNPEYCFTLESPNKRLFSSQHLTSLELTGVQLDDEILGFPECPVLESLKLEASAILSMEMQSPSLKHLSIRNCFFHIKCRIWMSLPGLVSFEFINNCGRAPLLERMPHLEAAKVQFERHYADCCENGRLDDCGDAACRGCSNYYGHGESGSLFLHGLAEATYLYLSAYPDMYVFSRDLKWCPAFNKLKTLVLSKWFLSTDLSALIWFLHHTPLLEKLTLEIFKEHESLMEPEGSYNPLEKSIAASHVQTVDVICKDVDGIVLKVLKVLNANGIPLGKIRIQCSGYDFVCTNISSM